MTAPAPIIRATGLTKRFGDFTAVDHLTFEVEPGTIFAFLGANGSGKSTTIRMLIGLLRPTAGTIEVDGVDVIHWPRRVREHIGYMGQRVSLYQGLTLHENLEFYAGLYGLGGAALERRWGELRERFALGEAEDERAGDLPAGVRQRAGLALSTLHRPRVLFLDEPTAGVDVQNRLLFWDRIQEEAAVGVTVFVTTHFLEEVEYCDWVTFIDAGRLIANGTPDAIREAHSPGYEVRIALEPPRRSGAVAALRRGGLAVEETDDGVRARAPTVDGALLATIAEVGGPPGEGRVRIEHPDMTDAFRELMLAAADAPTDAARTPSDPAPAPPAARASPHHASAAPPFRPVPPGQRWRRLSTLMVREVRATLRNVATVFILVTVPLAAILTWGYVLSTEVQGLALGVHDADGTRSSRRLVAELGAGGSFAPRPYATREALEHALVAGTISVGLIVPPDFERALHRSGAGHAPPEVQVLYDGAETVLAGNAEGYLRGLLAATTQELLTEHAGRERAPPRGVTLATSVLFNPDLDGVPFMVAGTFGFVLTFLTTLITAVSIVNERLSGTFEQLQVTPATSLEIVLGKILPLGAVFSFDVVIMMVAAGLVFGVWPAGSVLLFLTISSLYIVVSLAVGLTISTTSATPAAAVQTTVLSSIPLIFLSGFAFPIPSMPLLFRWFAELIPATHYIRITRAIYLRAAGPELLVGSLAIVLLLGAALVTIAVRSMETRT